MHAPQPTLFPTKLKTPISPSVLRLDYLTVSPHSLDYFTVIPSFGYLIASPTGLVTSLPLPALVTACHSHCLGYIIDIPCFSCSNFSPIVWVTSPPFPVLVTSLPAPLIWLHHCHSQFWLPHCQSHCLGYLTGRPSIRQRQKLDFNVLSTAQGHLRIIKLSIKCTFNKLVS